MTGTPTPLNVTFKGRTNAEAKNCKGKTDILVKTKDGLNEHIFELKVWNGIETLQKQLSNYKIILVGIITTVVLLCSATNQTSQLF